jgi:hypothetical protein
MIELVIAVVGTLLLISAGTVRRPSPQPLRNRKRSS